MFICDVFPTKLTKQSLHFAYTENSVEISTKIVSKLIRMLFSITWLPKLWDVTPNRVAKIKFKQLMKKN